ncbi:MAG: hypothetical protein CMF11_02410 [Idiomarina sp.]|nr:hypothetical protein [Idiomarina sp.]
MPISHRSHRLRLVGSPAVQQLHGGRYRLTFKLVTTNPREDWYNSNKSNIFADYGSLQSAPFDTNGVEPRTGEAYDDMRLVKASAGAEGDGYSVVFVYETLTSTFVNESEDKIDFELNGLKRIVRTKIAKSDASLSGTIGTTTASQTETDVILAQVEDAQLAPDEGGFRRVVETYMQKGVLLVDVNNKYGTKAADSTENEFQIATIKVIGLTSSEALTASGLSGFSLFDQGEENVEGLSVFTYRFTKGSGEISRTTATEGLLTNVTITSVNEPPDDTDVGIVTKTDVQAREDALIYTYTFSSGSGTLETKTSTKYNSKLTITTERALNTVPSVPSGAYQVSASSEVSGVFTIHTLTYATGSGLIRDLTATKYNDVITVRTRVELNSTPDTGSETVISTSVEHGDYGQVHTVISYSGQGEIQKDIQNRYDDKLTVTTLANINNEPTVPPTAYLMKSSVRDTEYGPITSKTFAEGSGKIEDSTTDRLVGPDGSGGKIEEKRERHLNPDTEPNTPDGFTRVSRVVTDGDFGNIVELVFIKGDGLIRKTEETRNDGSVVTTIVRADDTEPTSSDVTGTIGTDTFLVSTDVNSAQGYNLTTYKYYGIPQDYTVPFSTLLNKPDEIDADTSGVFISDPGSSEPYTGTTSVSFHTTAPEVEALSDLEPSVTIVERAVFSDGTVLADHTTFRNAFTADTQPFNRGATNTSFLYREKQAVSADVNAFGSTNGSPFTGTLTVVFEVVPYLTVGGTTIYKKTKSTVSATTSSTTST